MASATFLKTISPLCLASLCQLNSGEIFRVPDDEEEYLYIKNFSNTLDLIRDDGKTYCTCLADGDVRLFYEDQKVVLVETKISWSDM